MIGGPKGAAIGAIGGGIIGGFSGGAQEDADKQRQAAIQQAMAEQEQIRRQMARKQEEDLAKTMAFYGPAMGALEHLYGIPASAFSPPPGQPARTGTFNGMPATAAPIRPEFAGQVRNLSATKPLVGAQRMGTLRPGLQASAMGRQMPVAPPPAPPPTTLPPGAYNPWVNPWNRS